ncbi:MAG TPA: CUAEP/CCAEP-tail radical SAM protein, partial [Acidimicrobiia bacterium]|nr:CUAEP/CCAEP-tail radical SAM protein [Acidimicrobiia bacterium]
ALQQELSAIVERAASDGEAMPTTYARVRTAVGAPPREVATPTTPRPHLTESWFCCAEPTEQQLGALR